MKIENIVNQPASKRSVPEVVEQVNKNLIALDEQRIVGERVHIFGDKGAYQTQAQVMGGEKQIEIQTDVNNDGLQSHISLHRLEGDSIYPEPNARKTLRPIKTTQGQAVAAFAVRALMNTGVPFDKAVIPFRPVGDLLEESGITAKVTKTTSKLKALVDQAIPKVK